MHNMRQNAPYSGMQNGNAPHYSVQKIMTKNNASKIVILKKITLGRLTSTTVCMVILCMMMCAPTLSFAAIDVYEFDSPQQEAQYRGLIENFRCPTCQNQNLAGSDAPIAQDLKQRTYDLVQQGRSDAEIYEYMHARYGDFISYKPPVRPSTWILWFFPPLVLIVALLVWIYRTRLTKTVATDETLNNNDTKQLAQILAQYGANNNINDGANGDASHHINNNADDNAHNIKHNYTYNDGHNQSASAYANHVNHDANINAIDDAYRRNLNADKMDVDDKSTFKKGAI